jgi:transcriptional regulator with GAF, ATPase, and Fis domain
MATRRMTRDRFEIARFRVRVTDGPDAPLAVESSGEEITIGTGPGQTLQLRDRCVSRIHCVIRVNEDGLLLEDLGSTNGTYMSGRRTQSSYVAAGDPITIGETTVTIEPLAEPHIEAVSGADCFGRVLGRSLAMRRLFAVLERVAPSDATLLLEGETGTGKSALAEAVHEQSRRAERPCVIVDVAALPAALIESELFGHEKGAFTGANETRVGLFEAANGGTVVLEEIGELPLDLQPKLLRVLERRTIKRVGSQKQIPVDVRVIAATNRDLRRCVNAGEFRADLWYRISTVRMVVPPLRERREDIVMLIAHFYKDLCDDPSANPPAELVRALLRGTWKGNVRELASAVERSLILRRPVLDTSPGVDELDMTVPFRAAKSRATTDWEKRYLAELLAAHDGNISKAARAAQMDRGHLSEMLRRHGLGDAPEAAVAE